MRRRPFLRSRLAAALAAVLAPAAAPAVSIDPDGLGQALIYPYYTVRATEGNAFNTYVSIVNSTGDAKAVRVRVREGRAGRETASFNLYLSPNDAWTAAIVPTLEGARLLTADSSCTDPLLEGGLLALRNDAFNDALGDTLDRTREGYVEMIEMAVLTGDARAATTHNSAGVPMNCAAMRANASPAVAAPSGGLWGTLTLINVNNGQDFTLDAVALSELSTRPFYRAASDPYPDLNAQEIDPVSTVVANGRLYRSAWSRPVDAVSALLMASEMVGEYVLDTASASQTDLILLAPTRHFYMGAQENLPPFGPPPYSQCEPGAAARSSDYLGVVHFNRDQRSATSSWGSQAVFEVLPFVCASASVASIYWYAQATPMTIGPTRVTGSTVKFMGGGIPVTNGFENGFFHFSLDTRPPRFTSLQQSTRTELATGEVHTGAHTYSGLPLRAFTLRTFRNGTLACSATASCQGNYGGAFPFAYKVTIAP